MKLLYILYCMTQYDLHIITPGHTVYIYLCLFIYPISKHNGYPAMFRYSVDPNLTLLYDSIWFSYHHNSSYRLLKCQFILSDLYKFEITIHILLYDPIWSSYHYTRSYSLYIPLSVHISDFQAQWISGYVQIFSWSKPNITVWLNMIFISSQQLIQIVKVSITY